MQQLLNEFVTVDKIVSEWLNENSASNKQIIAFSEEILTAFCFSLIHGSEGVNLDSTDISHVLKSAKGLKFGKAQATSIELGLETAKQAWANALTIGNQDLVSQQIILGIRTSPECELEMDDLNLICDFFQQQVSESTDVIFGFNADLDSSKAIEVAFLVSFL